MPRGKFNNFAQRLSLADHRRRGWNTGETRSYDQTEPLYVSCGYSLPYVAVDVTPIN